MKFSSKLILVFFLILYANSAFSEKSAVEEFNGVYAEYQDFVNKGDKPNAKKSSEKMFKLAQKVYDKDSLDFAYITKIYLFSKDEYSHNKTNISLIKNVIKTFERNTRVSKVEIIEAYMMLGKMELSLSNDRSKLSEPFVKAIEISQTTGDVGLLAETQLQIGIVKLLHGLLNDAIVERSRTLFAKAFQSLKKLDNPLQYKASFWLGKANLMLKNYEDSIINFKDVIEGARGNKSLNLLEGSAHAFLIKAYTNQGQNNLATEHCQAIGRMQAWDDTKEPTPLYRSNLRYPKKAAMQGLEGWVKIKFVIDKNGIVKDQQVVDGAQTKIFSREALRAIRDWRFAPRFIDGKAVDSTTFYTMRFVLGTG